MKSKLKTIGAILAIASLTGSSMNSTYKIKSEKGNVVDKVELRVHGPISMSQKLATLNG